MNILISPALAVDRLFLSNFPIHSRGYILLCILRQKIVSKMYN